MTKTDTATFSSVFKTVRRFLPLFLLAIIVPFLVGLVVTPPQVGFLTKADAKSQLRIWFEPANVIMSPGSQATFSIVAQYEGDNSISEMTFNLLGTGQSVLSENSLRFSQPFRGKTEVRKITVRSLAPGESVISIDKESIVLIAFSKPVEIRTSTANIITK